MPTKRVVRRKKRGRERKGKRNKERRRRRCMLMEERMKNLQGSLIITGEEKQ